MMRIYYTLRERSDHLFLSTNVLLIPNNKKNVTVALMNFAAFCRALQLCKHHKMHGSNKGHKAPHRKFIIISLLKHKTVNLSSLIAITNQQFIILAFPPFIY